MNQVITTEHLSFKYPQGDMVIVNATVEITAGEFVGIIGPNGGGKTTFLKLLMGFLEPTEGAIRINGESPKKHSNCIAYVPQMIKFDRAFPITLHELVLGGRAFALPFWGRYQKNDIEKSLEAIEKVGLIDMKDAPFNSLSGGQMQRALIARAIASEAKIFLLDEPTAHIDFKSTREIVSLLHELQRGATLTILMVAHDLEIMVREVSRFLCIQGEVMASSSAEICEHFALGLYHYPLAHTPHSHLRGTT